MNFTGLAFRLLRGADMVVKNKQVGTQPGGTVHHIMQKEDPYKRILQRRAQTRRYNDEIKVAEPKLKELVRKYIVQSNDNNELKITLGRAPKTDPKTPKELAKAASALYSKLVKQAASNTIVRVPKKPSELSDIELPTYLKNINALITEYEKKNKELEKSNEKLGLDIDARRALTPRELAEDDPRVPGSQQTEGLRVDGSIREADLYRPPDEDDNQRILMEVAARDGEENLGRHYEKVRPPNVGPRLTKEQKKEKKRRNREQGRE